MPRQEAQTLSQLSERVKSLSSTASDVEKAARDYMVYRDPSFERQYQDARGEYRLLSRESLPLAELQSNDSLRRTFTKADSAYRQWLQASVIRQFATAKRGPSPNLAGYAIIAGRDFAVVQDEFNGLQTATNDLRDTYKQRAQIASVIRLSTAIVIPLVAVLVAALIGRSFALGITRPIESLTKALKEVEQGKNTRFLLDDPNSVDVSDDEIGDLQKAFKAMARTIGQREAALRAQNAAGSALTRRVESVLNATNDGILMLDRVGGFSVINHRFAYLFGIDMDVLLDQTFSQAGTLILARFRNRDTVRARFQQTMDNPNDIMDETFEIAEPIARTLRVYSAPVRSEGENAELMGRIFVFRDVTRETTVDRMKTEFVSTVSHELRTPLTAIKGYVDILLSQQTGELTELQAEFLGMAQNNTVRLTNLINDMLDISRIEAGRIEVRQEFVEYLPLVRQTMRLMSREAETRHVALEMSIAGGEEQSFPLVSGDSDRITQVLVNLVSNSIKYTPSGGTVTVTVDYEGDFVTTCVADTGIGISANDQKKLFQKFFRADNSLTREVGGTGLGLAITKAVLEKLNGSIWVESETGQGSKFWFTLPTTETLATNEAQLPPPDAFPTSPPTADPEAKPAVPVFVSVTGSHITPSDFFPDTHSEENATPASVLVLSIDGDPAALHRLGHELRQQGFVTANAATPADALRRARDLRPDIITLDPLTENMDGFAVLRALRENSLTRAVPVALVTLRLGGGRAEICSSCDFLPRTISEKHLGESLHKALPTNGLREALILVVGDDEFARRIRHCLPGRDGKPTARLIVAVNAIDVDAQLGTAAPHLVVLDTAALPGDQAGALVRTLKKRRPDARLPVLAITDEAVYSAEGPVVLLAPMGSEAISLTRLGETLRLLLARYRNRRIPPADPAAETKEVESAGSPAA